tara:strand:- start:2932 stop:3063 length:132 start_codon:yes stop_codon:yes gene_type:complete
MTPEEEKKLSQEIREMMTKHLRTRIVDNGNGGFDILTEWIEEE